METISNINDFINNIVWGVPMLILLLGVGLFYTIRLKFVQFTKIKYIFKNTFKKMFTSSKGKGDIPSGQAALLSLGGVVGSGNIAGVATAVAAGGPGALFWMWIAALAGMATKFAEITLGLKYREKKEDGTYIGGPMKYLQKGVKSKFLAAFYSIMAILSYIVIVAMVDTNTIVGAINAKFTVESWVIALVLVIIVGYIIFGGIKRLGKFSKYCTPIMGIIYIVAGLLVVILNITSVPEAIGIIFKSAFTPQSATGGFLGASVMTIIRYGVARGMYSNEAGLGTAAINHSSSTVENPIQQSIWGPVEVFLDTIIICTITGLVIVMSGQWTSGVDGAELVISSFSSILPGFLGTASGYIIMIVSFLFSFTCLITSSYVCEQCGEYLFGIKSKYVIKVLWLLFIVVGALTQLDFVWSLADTVNGIMAIPNIIGLFILSNEVVKLKKKYLK